MKHLDNSMSKIKLLKQQWIFESVLNEQKQQQK